MSDDYASGHRIVSALRRGEVVNLEGLLFVQDEGEIKPGDAYVAERNTTGLYVARRINTGIGCIHPEGTGYSFNIYECVKVREAGIDPDKEGFTLNGFVDSYPHNDLEGPCTWACCEPDEYPRPYRWQCQGENCSATLRKPGECINCAPPAVTAITSE